MVNELLQLRQGHARGQAFRLQAPVVPFSLLFPCAIDVVTFSLCGVVRDGRLDLGGIPSSDRRSRNQPEPHLVGDGDCRVDKDLVAALPLPLLHRLPTMPRKRDCRRNNFRQHVNLDDEYYALK